MILVTGGAGFIGSNFIRHWMETEGSPVHCYDKLTYAGSRKRLPNDPNVRFSVGCIGDRAALYQTFLCSSPDAVINFAAETHVTRSIHDPAQFIETNVRGTLALLEESLDYWRCLPSSRKDAFRFVHISTDEVFGSLEPRERAFTESSPYRPSTPYAASKAAADHLVRAFHVTYGLPILIVHPTNNYGPGQHEEKLIPLCVRKILDGDPIEVHGDGRGTRDWLHVDDCCDAIRTVYRKGGIGESYCVGANNEVTVLATIEAVMLFMCGGAMVHVPDRPGNDRRYAVNAAKVRALGWEPKRQFLPSLYETLEWHRKHLNAAA